MARVAQVTLAITVAAGIFAAGHAVGRISRLEEWRAEHRTEVKAITDRLERLERAEARHHPD